MCCAYFVAKFIDLRGLPIVQPGVVEHESDVVDVLPWIRILSVFEFSSDRRQIYRILDDV